MQKPDFHKEAREIRLKIAKGIFEDKWPSNEVDRREEEIISLALQSAYKRALEDSCKIVFGQCDSDNVAQRTVDAIRKLKQESL